MTDLEHILPLWHEMETTGTAYVLATVVAVEGPSYRKPGARMLLTQDGRRAGTISGGCLEAEVARRCWWLTSAGPVVERYSTADDDGDRPYGSGCGGVVIILLERRETAGPAMRALEAAFNGRVPLAIATILDGKRIGQRVFAGLAQNGSQPSSPAGRPSAMEGPDLQHLATMALERCAPIDTNILLNGVLTRVWTDYRAARPGLWIFSAGDDAKPLVQLARQLGWYVVVADGRAHLATRERFPAADTVRVLPIADLPEAAPAHFRPHPTDAAVVMTHSFEQDSRVLASLLALDFPLAYLGVLGPQRRTRELLAEAAHLLGLPATNDRVDQWLAQMYAPTGLDLGAETPATIALSILAEIQKVLAAASAEPLRLVRAANDAVSQC